MVHEIYCTPVNRESFKDEINHRIDYSEDYVEQYNAVFNKINKLKQQIESCKCLNEEKVKILALIDELCGLLLSADITIRDLVFKQIYDSENSIENVFVLSYLIKDYLGKINPENREFFISIVNSQVFIEQ